MSLPDWFGFLSQLTMLDLECVSPSSSPPRRRVTCGVHCVHVVVIVVVVVYSANQLTSLPESFGNLTQLTSLGLECVSLSSSPLRRRIMRYVYCVCVSTSCSAITS